MAIAFAGRRVACAVLLFALNERRIENAKAF